MRFVEAFTAISRPSDPGVTLVGAHRRRFDHLVKVTFDQGGKLPVEPRTRVVTVGRKWLEDPVAHERFVRRDEQPVVDVHRTAEPYHGLLRDGGGRAATLPGGRSAHHTRR
jgi:hypothetical protein